MIEPKTRVLTDQNGHTLRVVDDEFYALQAERDALAAQVDYLRKVVERAIFIADSENWFCDVRDFRHALSLLPQHHLAAHDAEVAKAAYLQCKADFSEPHETWWVNSDTHIDMAEKYAAQLRAKAKP